MTNIELRCLKKTNIELRCFACHQTTQDHKTIIHMINNIGPPQSYNQPVMKTYQDL